MVYKACMNTRFYERIKIMADKFLIPPTGPGHNPQVGTEYKREEIAEYLGLGDGYYGVILTCDNIIKIGLLGDYDETQG